MFTVSIYILLRAGLVLGSYPVNELNEIQGLGLGWADLRDTDPTSHPTEKETEVLLPTRRMCSLMVSSSVRSSPASKLIRTTFLAQR